MGNMGKHAQQAQGQMAIPGPQAGLLQRSSIACQRRACPAMVHSLHQQGWRLTPVARDRAALRKIEW